MRCVRPPTASGPLRPVPDRRVPRPATWMPKARTGGSAATGRPPAITVRGVRWSLRRASRA